MAKHRVRRMLVSRWGPPRSARSPELAVVFGPRWARPRWVSGRSGSAGRRSSGTASSATRALDDHRHKLDGQDRSWTWCAVASSGPRASPFRYSAPPPSPPAAGCTITWYGHATTLVEIEGRRVLLDPVWSDRCSPSQLVGPSRLHPLPYPLDRAARVDAVVISHDHYDHLDMATIKALAPRPVRAVPGAARASGRTWSAGASRESGSSSWTGTRAPPSPGSRFTITAARHFSGRGFARDRTLWGSWVDRRPDAGKVFYTGDTGYFDGFARIGAEHGPFDATLVQVGAYGEGWPDIHMTPEDGVQAHVDVRGGLLVPVHWCTFVLAFHAWAEPADRVVAGGEGARRPPRRAPARASGSTWTTRPRWTAGGRTSPEPSPPRGGRRPARLGGRRVHSRVTAPSPPVVSER